MPAEKLVVFIHIPKAAGTTTRAILAANYDAPTLLNEMIHGRTSVSGGAKGIASLDYDVEFFLTQVWAAEKNLRCVAINLPYGLHNFIDRPITYFSILRDPVERCLSLWFEAYRNRSVSSLWAIFEKYGFDIQAIIASKEAPELQNDQTRMLSGCLAFDCTDTEVRLALSNVQAGRIIVGFVESYPQSISLIGDKLGWSQLQYIPLNQAESKPACILPTGAREILREANQIDIELVARCRRRCRGK